MDPLKDKKLHSNPHLSTTSNNLLLIYQKCPNEFQAFFQSQQNKTSDINNNNTTTINNKFIPFVKCIGINFCKNIEYPLFKNCINHLNEKEILTINERKECLINMSKCVARVMPKLHETVENLEKKE
ncbi:hypothetical protein ABK040_010710 [Willaertia magna]